MAASYIHAPKIAVVYGKQFGEDYRHRGKEIPAFAGMVRQRMAENYICAPKNRGGLW